MPDTREARFVREPRAPGRMRGISEGPGEGIALDATWRSLGCLIHMSDLHVCDAQSPSRVEYFDRYADPDSVIAAEIGYVGVYRAHEMLTTQVLRSAVDAVNEVEAGPSGAPVDAVIITGDTVDNAQHNELRWYTTLLDGGEITPSSGDPTRWEGVGAPDDPDERYWHPEGGVPDLPRTVHGFPTVPGFFALAQRAIHSPGLRHRWLAIHGNHDALLQGVTNPDADVEALSTGDQRVLHEAEGADVTKLLLDFSPIGPATFPFVPGSPTTPVTADPERSFLRPGGYAAAHLACGHGHGFTADNVETGTAYWTCNLNDDVMLVALDTVNRHGGWHGCLDRVQFEWLRQVLENADRYVIVMSHHPVETLVNGHTAGGDPAPALAAEVVELLQSHPKVLLWVAGHTHRHEISYVGEHPGHGFWHIRTSSLIDWPQQSRVIELLETSDGVAIATYVFDHNGVRQPDVLALQGNDDIAGLSRWLAANNWQRQEGEHPLDVLEGRREDRNVVLHLDRR